MTSKDLRRVVLAMDSKRKDDLLVSLVDAVFDDFFDYSIDYAENLSEIIENITGLENLSEYLPELR
jgi:hypothetical protein